MLYYYLKNILVIMKIKIYPNVIHGDVLFVF